MATLGRPQKANNFGNISKATPAQRMKGAKEQKIGDKLNRLAGIRKDHGFVDAKKHNQLGKDGFLKLLSHQLANQDPLKPMDQSKFAADLAQFSQLEQLANMNSKMDKMQQNAPSENKFYGASFLGKEIVTSATTIKYSGDGERLFLPFYLEKSARNLMVRVFDSRNQMIAQIEKEGMGEGPNSVSWDGTSLDGTNAVKDNYRFEVRAWDEEMNEFKGETKGTGLVTAVNFENGETILTLKGGKKVFLRDVDSFKLPEAQEGVGQKMPVLQKNAAQAYNEVGTNLN